MNLSNGNESQPGKHRAPTVSKPYAQAYAVHRRDAPLKALPNFPIHDPRLPPGNQLSSPAFRTDDAAQFSSPAFRTDDVPPIPDLDLLPRNMAGVQRCRSYNLLCRLIV
ncbi:MAG: hypothetical protein Q9226_007392 [Calogaya cf. arnoldii]